MVAQALAHNAVEVAQLANITGGSSWHSSESPQLSGTAHHNRCKVATSFEGLNNGGLYHLVKDMQHVAQTLVDLDQSLQDTMQQIPEAIQRLHENFEPVQTDITQTLQDSLREAKVVRNKIDTYNERMEESVKRAKKFNALISKQENYEENKLPIDMNEMAGAVISHLVKAQKIGKMLLDKDAKELIKVAKAQSEKYSAETASAPGPLLAYLVAAARQATVQDIRQQEDSSSMSTSGRALISSDRAASSITISKGAARLRVPRPVSRARKKHAFGAFL